MNDYIPPLSIPVNLAALRRDPSFPLLLREIPQTPHMLDIDAAISSTRALAMEARLEQDDEEAALLDETCQILTDHARVAACTEFVRIHEFTVAERTPAL